LPIHPHNIKPIVLHQLKVSVLITTAFYNGPLLQAYWYMWSQKA